VSHRSFNFAMPASAAVVFDAFHYHHWRHRWDSLVSTTAVEGGHSELVYTYTFEVGPRVIAWCIRPFVERIFEHQTCKRFGRLSAYLASHASEITSWQQKRVDHA
jgi:hypothetical protein